MSKWDRVRDAAAWARIVPDAMERLRVKLAVIMATWR